ncbi:MAG TPA: hypothetical protein VF593_05580 [Chthoniobacteraceae bacterium]|jgi:hypothetical protein
MRFLGGIFIVTGILLLIYAGYEEARGVVKLSYGSKYIPPALLESASDSIPRKISRRQVLTATRVQDPAVFRALMYYKWARGPVCLIPGLLILRLLRRQERLNPFSPGFPGLSSLNELDRVMAEEEQKHHRPLRY